MNGRKCPVCLEPIEKNGGCQMMTCICGHMFCWKCMKSFNDCLYQCHNIGPSLEVGTTQNISIFQPIIGRVNRASATETVDLDSIPGRVKPKIMKIAIHSFLAWRSVLKGTVWSLDRVWYKQIGRLQLDLKTEQSFRCLLAKSTWWIKCNYDTILQFILYCT